ncbi:TIGR03067 domain-containing protein [Pseudomonas sp. CCM 7893]|uniref:TIGR03067 domain-containing protein n=1 Tax=Pseudomonas spelaei TaxID=1055469 RepID=A0A6I3W0Q2_9PSED|nr:TIGR03067 domain-containing protein [Pseudomonas spelaei]MUF04220.1 TIGR03067 domain-containing protein [Pseudomonas spelaei]
MPSVSTSEEICINAHDRQRLQGDWVQTALEDSGVLNPVDEHSAPGAVTTISGDQFQVVTLTGEVLLAGRFTLDATTTPKAIIWVDAIGADAGKQLPASYRLEGDHFIFIAADEGKPRPTRFSTAPGQTMRTFVRKASVTSNT